MPAQTYTLTDVRRLTGAKRSQVEHWARQQLLTESPSIRETGTGVHRRFTFRNLVEIAVLVAMNRMRLSIAPMRDVMKQWRDAAHVYASIDMELAHLKVVEGDTRPWGDRLAAVFDEITKGKPVQWAESVRDAWLLQSVEDPRTRPRRSFFVIAPVALNDDAWVLTVRTDAADAVKYPLGVHGGLVIDIRDILTTLENATGDRIRFDIPATIEWVREDGE